MAKFPQDLRKSQFLWTGGPIDCIHLPLAARKSRAVVKVVILQSNSGIGIGIGWSFKTVAGRAIRVNGSFPLADRKSRATVYPGYRAEGCVPRNIQRNPVQGTQ